MYTYSFFLSYYSSNSIFLLHVNLLSSLLTVLIANVCLFELILLVVLIFIFFLDSFAFIRDSTILVLLLVVRFSFSRNYNCFLWLLFWNYIFSSNFTLLFFLLLIHFTLFTFFFGWCPPNFEKILSLLSLF